MKDYSNCCIEDCVHEEVIRAFVGQILRDPEKTINRMTALCKSMGREGNMASHYYGFMNMAARIGCLSWDVKTSADK